MTTGSHRPLRVGIKVGSIDETSGGVQQFVMGLALGLSKLTDGDEEYLFFTQEDAHEWLRPYINGPCQILEGTGRRRLARFKRRFGSAFPVIREAWHEVSALRWGRDIGVPYSDGTIEKAGVEIIHFPSQGAFLTKVTSIYHPWDLQHLHLPKFFSPWARRLRDRYYAAFCEQARMVCVASTWTKRDLIRHLRVPEEKLRVVPPAPLLHAYPNPTAQDLDAMRTRHSLPEAFAFYPAQTWPHKNHIRLMEALFLLRAQWGLTIPFVFTGFQNDFFRQIKRHVERLRLGDQVRFLGFVTPLELQCLYKLCRCMVFPSEFEGFGFPVVEAFLAGAPTACSSSTSLPDLAGDAALIFDPEKPEEIAEAILRIWTDEGLRRTLVERGRINVARFSWEKSARIFRAHYRRLANRPLTEEDRALIEAPPPV